MNFTREQQLALDYKRHLVVSAGAGSGKTRVLVERYVQILLQRKPNAPTRALYDVRSIVAITFTKKAANEMLQRVAKRIDEEYSKATAPIDLFFLRTVRERVTSARVTTIHSFCSSLLRDYPIEAKVSPNFTELSTGDFIHICKRALQNTFEHWLSDPVLKERATPFFLTMQLSEIEEMFLQLLKNGEQLAQLENFYSTNSDSEIQRNALLLFSRQYQQLVYNAIEELQSIVSLLEQKPKRSDSLEKILQKLKDVVKDLDPKMARLLDSHSIQQVSTVIIPCSRALEILYTGDNTFRAAIRKALPDTWLGFQILDPLAQSLLVKGKAPVKLFNEDLFESSVRFGRLIYDMVRDAMQEVEAEKLRLSALTYDDLILKTLQLLQNEDVCNHLRKKIKFLMVDEFQDTNQVQYDIVLRLAHILQKENSALVDIESPNVFIVGDAKQSIYGFRNADVRVFEQAKNDISRANTIQLQAKRIPQIENASEEENAGLIALSASFRMVPQLVAFVNHVCKNIMPAHSIGWEVGYEEMVSARVPETYSDITSNIELHFVKDYSKKGLSYEDFEESDDLDDSNENEAIAIRIEQIVHGTNALMVWDEHEKKSRKAEYRDIAILGRNKSQFNSISSALNAKGIPSVVHSGKGFFEAVEVIDFVAFLQFLHNTSNDIALATILRSPFFLLSPTALHTIGRQPLQSSYWDRMESWVALNPIDETSSADDKEIHEAHSILRKILPYALRIPIPQLLQLILEKTIWLNTVRFQDRKEQLMANVEKFFQFARDFERRGTKNLFDFLEEIERLSIYSDEAEAPILTSENVVNIMTIHASKGLEFPIVIINKTNPANRSHRKKYMIHPSMGICVPIRSIITETQPTLPFKLSTQSQTEAESAEEKRLLYVAITRAKEHCLLFATLKVKEEDGVEIISPLNSFSEMVCSAFGMYPSGQILTNTQRQHSNRVKFLTTNGVQEQDLSYSLTVRISPEVVEINKPTVVTRETIEKNVDIEPVYNYVKGEYVSASQLMLFKKDPIEYLYRYRLGFTKFDEDTLSASQAAPTNDNEELSATQTGIIIHAMIAAISLWTNDQGEFLQPEFDALLRKQLHLHSCSSVEKTQRIKRECSSILATEYIQNNLSALCSAKHEYKVTMPLADDFLTGTMDALVQIQQGEFEIWDWKTNKADTVEDRDKLIEQYTFQMKVYAFLLSHTFKHQSQFTARLFFTRYSNTNSWIHTISFSRKDLAEFNNELVTLINDAKRFSLLM